MEILVFSPKGPLVAQFDQKDRAIAEIGWRAHFLSGKPYLRKGITGETLLAHRMVCGCVAGDGTVVDHINGDTLDNRRKNLRVVTALENAWNRKSNSRTGFYGVSSQRGKYIGRIRHKGKYHYCGQHDTAEAAARAVTEKLEQLRADYVPASIKEAV